MHVTGNHVYRPPFVQTSGNTRAVYRIVEVSVLTVPILSVIPGPPPVPLPIAEWNAVASVTMAGFNAVPPLPLHRPLEHFEKSGLSYDAQVAGTPPAQCGPENIIAEEQRSTPLGVLN